MSEQTALIGKTIRQRRTALHLSQRDLARAAGTTAAAISHIERGVRNLSAGLLARIADTLQCPVDDLLHGDTPAAESSPYVSQVVAAMKGLPPPLQREVADFCAYLKHRDRRSDH